MKKIVMLLTGFIFVYASVFAQLIVHSPTNDKPSFVYVGGYATQVELNKNSYDIVGMINKTHTATKSLASDSVLTIFIPPTATTNAQVVYYTTKQLQSGVEVTLTQAVKSDPNYQIWSFDSPKVQRSDGKNAIGGKLYIHGASDVVSIIDGSFNGSFYLPKTQKEIQYIIVSSVDGRIIGDLHVDKVVLPDYKPGSRHSFATQPIIVQPPKNKLVYVTFQNISNPLIDTSDVLVQADYCYDGSGYHYEVIVKSGAETLFGSIDISDYMGTSYTVALTPNRTKGCQVSNPKTESLPTIIQTLSLYQKQQTVSNRSFNDGKTKMDPALKNFLLVMLFCAGVLIWYLVRRKRKNNK